ncbi:hypothetical protein KIPB_014654, partial [Kipferlia bialata]
TQTQARLVQALSDPRHTQFLEYIAHTRFEMPNQ